MKATLSTERMGAPSVAGSSTQLLAWKPSTTAILWANQLLCSYDAVDRFRRVIGLFTIDGVVAA